MLILSVAALAWCLTEIAMLSFAWPMYVATIIWILVAIIWILVVSGTVLLAWCLSDIVILIT